MPISFPNNPTVGQIYTYNANSWTWDGEGWEPSGGAGGATITVSENKPASTTEGSLWLDENTGDVAVYFNGGWAGISGGGGSSGGGVAAVYDVASTSTGYFSLPAGTTAQRPETAANGMTRFNTTLGTMEQYNVNGWQSIGGSITVANVSPSSFTGNSGTQFTISGLNFTSGCTVSFITSSSNEYIANVTSFLNSTQLLATTPRNFTVADEPLSVKVTNPDGVFAVKANAIDCGATPTFSTGAGSLGSIFDVNRDGSYSLLSAAATDADAQSVTYSIASGSIPAGMTFNTANAAITGTPNSVGADTTYTFTVSATDGLNTNSRQFSITVKAAIVQTFTTAGTFSWTAPTGLTKIGTVIMIGGGGGGSSGNGQWAAGGAGAGFCKYTNLPVTAGATYSLVVGAKGLGATTCGAAGTNGGNTTAFTNVAFGGTAGLVGPVGGTGGSYTLNVGTNNGSANGTNGNSSTGDGSGGGGQNGGGSLYGTGAAGVANGTAGNHAAGYGNGGGGGHSCQGGHRGGGDGSGGYIELRY